MKYCFNCNEYIDTNEDICPKCHKNIKDHIPEYHLKEGEVLNGKYKIVMNMKENNSEILYKAIDTSTQSEVLIKEYYNKTYVNSRTNNSLNLLNNMKEQEYKKELNNVLKYLKTLIDANQNCIQKISDSFEENNTIYSVYEYIEGISLKQYVQKYGKINYSTIINGLTPVMNSLIILHSHKLYNQFITPNNIVLTKDEKLVLTRYNYEDSFSWKDAYDITKKEGAWIDIYGLCCTIYYCTTKISPISNGTLLPIKKHIKSMDNNLNNVIMKGMLKVDRQKYDGIFSFAREINPYIKENEIQEFKVEFNDNVKSNTNLKTEDTVVLESEKKDEAINKEINVQKIDKLESEKTSVENDHENAVEKPVKQETVVLEHKKLEETADEEVEEDIFEEEEIIDEPEYNDYDDSGYDNFAFLKKTRAPKELYDCVVNMEKYSKINNKQFGDECRVLIQSICNCIAKDQKYTIPRHNDGKEYSTFELLKEYERKKWLIPLETIRYNTITNKMNNINFYHFIRLFGNHAAHKEGEKDSKWPKFTYVNNKLALENTYKFLRCYYEKDISSKDNKVTSYKDDYSRIGDYIIIDAYTPKDSNYTNCVKEYIAYERIDRNSNNKNYFIIRQYPNRGLKFNYLERPKVTINRINDSDRNYPEGMPLIKELTGIENRENDFYLIAYQFKRKPIKLSDMYFKQISKQRKLEICLRLARCFNKIHNSKNPIYHRMINRDCVYFMDFNDNNDGYDPMITRYEFCKLENNDIAGTVVNEKNKAYDKQDEILKRYKYNNSDDYKKNDIYALGVLFYEILSNNFEDKPNIEYLIDEYQSEELFNIIDSMTADIIDDSLNMSDVEMVLEKVKEQYDGNIFISTKEVKEETVEELIEGTIEDRIEETMETAEDENVEESSEENVDISESTELDNENNIIITDNAIEFNLDDNQHSDEDNNMDNEIYNTDTNEVSKTESDNIVEEVLNEQNTDESKLLEKADESIVIEQEIHNDVKEDVVKEEQVSVLEPKETVTQTFVTNETILDDQSTSDISELKGIERYINIKNIKNDFSNVFLKNNRIYKIIIIILVILYIFDIKPWSNVSNVETVNPEEKTVNVTNEVTVLATEKWDDNCKELKNQYLVAKKLNEKENKDIKAHEDTINIYVDDSVNLLSWFDKLYKTPVTISCSTKGKVEMLSDGTIKGVKKGLVYVVVKYNTIFKEEIYQVYVINVNDYE